MRGSFEQILQVGVDVHVEVARLESNHKLSTKGFLREAMALAGCDAERLVEIERLIESSSNVDSARAFLRRATKEYGSSFYPTPTAKIARAARLWGSENAQDQLAELGIRAGEIVALAARHATERWPENFGAHDSHDEHQKLIASARNKLDAACQRLEQNMKMDDLILTHEGLSDSERSSGHCIVTFRAYPDIRFAPDWPRLLVERAAAQRDCDAAPAKTSRKQLREKAA